MSGIKLFDNTLTLVSRAMHMRSQQHNRMVSDLVNVDTPNYQPFDVVIDEELAKLSAPMDAAPLRVTQPGHIRPAMADDGTDIAAGGDGDAVITRRADGNTVDLERTMAAMNENQIMYNTLAQITGRKFRGLKNAIRGGR